jgi:hypothetical protein
MAHGRSWIDAAEALTRAVNRVFALAASLLAADHQRREDEHRCDAFRDSLGPRWATSPPRCCQARWRIRAIVCLTRGLPLVVGPPHPLSLPPPGSAGPWERPELLNRANCRSCRRTAQLHSPKLKQGRPARNRRSRGGLHRLIHLGPTTFSHPCVECLQVRRLHNHLFTDQINKTR